MDFRASLETSGSGIGHAGGSGQPVWLEKISVLRPTQMAVGYREVCAKFQKLGACGADAQKRLIPVIEGPGGQFYLRDGHHLALALHLAGRSAVLVRVVADLSDLGLEAFWRTLEARNWVYPFDGSGRRQPLGRIPARLLEVEDDPFRSLAGALRRCGAYAKSTAPYADFAWADFLRRRIDPALSLRDFDAALAGARALAASRAAAHLPGRLGSPAAARLSASCLE
jgi:hypothetical protein